MKETLSHKYPDIKITLIYDEINLKSFENQLISSCSALNTILKELLRFNSNINLFLRIHGYRNWLVMKLKGNFVLPKNAANHITEEINELNGIINFSLEENIIVLDFSVRNL